MICIIDILQGLILVSSFLLMILLYFPLLTVRIYLLQHLVAITKKHLDRQKTDCFSKNILTIKSLRQKQCIGLLREFQPLIICKYFIRPHLDIGGATYDQLSNVQIKFSNKIESLQCNAVLAVTEALKNFSRDKLYQELGLEYLIQRRWMRKVCLLYKFLSAEQPSHIHIYFCN